MTARRGLAGPLVLLLGGAACTQTPILAQPSVVIAAPGTAGAERELMLTTTDGTRAELGRDAQVEVYTGSGSSARGRLGDLLATCAPPAAGSAPQVCDLQGVSWVGIGHERHLSSGAKQAIGATVVLGGLSAMIYCTAECDSPSNYIAGVGLGAVGVLAVSAVVVFVLAVSSLGHD